MNIRPSSDQHGFTLLEVMIAVAILASGLTAVVGGIGLSIRATSLAAGYESARTVANNQLALFVSTRPVLPIRINGVENAVRWTLNATTHPDTTALLRVEVEARFFAPGGERTLTLVTHEAATSIPDTAHSPQAASNREITTQ